MQMKSKRWDLEWRQEKGVKDEESGSKMKRGHEEHGMDGECWKVKDGVWRIQMENGGSQVKNTMMPVWFE